MNQYCNPQISQITGSIRQMFKPWMNQYCNQKHSKTTYSTNPGLRWCGSTATQCTPAGDEAFLPDSDISLWKASSCHAVTHFHFLLKFYESKIMCEGVGVVGLMRNDALNLIRSRMLVLVGVFVEISKDHHKASSTINTVGCSHDPLGRNQSSTTESPSSWKAKAGLPSPFTLCGSLSIDDFGPMEAIS